MNIVTPPDPAFLAHVEERKVALRAELAAILPAGQSVTLEIGSGHGHFLVRYAACHPHEFCAGVDIIGERIERAVRKRDRGRLANLHFFKNEASEFLECLPDRVRLTNVFVLFPDPWPKRRHHKKRLIQSAFLSQLAVATRPEGRLFFRTDHSAYFDAAQAVISAHKAWKIVPAATWPVEEPTVFQQKAPSYQSLVAVRSH